MHERYGGQGRLAVRRFSPTGFIRTDSAPLLDVMRPGRADETLYVRRQTTSKVRMLIRAFGQFWNPETIDWGKRGPNNRGKLLGRVRPKGRWHEIDFWDARGVYVLHADFKAVYVGKSVDRALGARLRDHLTDRFAGRWDMFSWFSLSTLSVKKATMRLPGIRQVRPGDVASTLEALGILIADPALNRRRERFASAVEAEQVNSPQPRTVRAYLEQIIERLPSNKAVQPTSRTKRKAKVGTPSRAARG